MKPSEALELVGELKKAYPRSGVSLETLATYARYLEDLEFEAGQAAVIELIATSKFFPAIAEIRDRATRTPRDAPAPAEAWGEVLRAVAKYGRDRSPKFDDPRIASAVHSIGWKEICNSQESDHSIIRAQFRKAMEAAEDRERWSANVGRLQDHTRQRLGSKPISQLVGGALKAALTDGDGNS